MRSNRFSRNLLATAAAAALVATMFAEPANGSLIIDLCATSWTGEGHSFTSNQINYFGPGVATFDVIATITPAVDNGNPNDEGFIELFAEFGSAGERPINFTSDTINSPYYNPPMSSLGTFVDLDGDGDIDIGSESPTASDGYWWAHSPTTGGISGQEHLLGTLTASISGSLFGPDTDVLFFKRHGAPVNTGSWIENGVTVAANVLNLSRGQSVRVVGPPIPEPTTLGLLGMIGFGTLARRKRRWRS